MGIMQRIKLCIFFVIFTFFSISSFGASIRLGNGKYTVSLHQTSLEIFTYKPNCPIKGILLVFHGNSRNAETYRNAAHKLANRLCMLIVAPLFDAKHFPGWRYQRGGIIHQQSLQKPADWTAQRILELIKWIRLQEGQTLPYSMIGHSAGAQFLSRLAAYTPTDAMRIVIANPSTYVLANLQINAPYGLGGVYPPHIAKSQLKRYLATPITVFLGEEDITNKFLNNSPAARAQGNKRYDRGLNAFHSAQTLAQSHGWFFNWRLVQVPGVGHNMIKMFSSPQAIEALSPDTKN